MKHDTSLVLCENGFPCNCGQVLKDNNRLIEKSNGFHFTDASVPDGVLRSDSKRHSVPKKDTAWDGTEEEEKTGDNSEVAFDGEAYMSSS